MIDVGAAIGGECVAYGSFRARAGDFGETEVENFCLAAGGDKNVGWFDVAVDDIFGVSGVESVGDVDGKFENGFEIEGSAGDGVLERFAFEALHGDEGFAVFLTDVVDGANVGVIEGGCGSCFTLKTGECLRIFCDGVGKKFERDETAQARVFAFVDDTHAATTEFLDDAVMGNSLAGLDWDFRHCGR